MISAFQWFMFGMFVWCCVICMEAVEQRVAPGRAKARSERRMRRRSRYKRACGIHSQVNEEPSKDDTREEELVQLRKRIETLEAIITDRRYQWDEEYKAE